jgi:hypothetical protein
MKITHISALGAALTAIAGPAFAAHTITTTYKGYVSRGTTSMEDAAPGTAFTAVYTAYDGIPGNRNYYEDSYGEVSGDVTALLSIDGYAPIAFTLPQNEYDYDVRWTSPTPYNGMQSRVYQQNDGTRVASLTMTVVNFNGGIVVGSPDVHADLDYITSDDDQRYGQFYENTLVDGEWVNTSAFFVITSVTSHSVYAADVPEPASWALMLGGFGLVGGALRSRRRAAVRFG